MSEHLSNADFLERHAAPGRVGLAGGSLLIERAIRRAQRHQRADRSRSAWSHAFLVLGRREDGRVWVLESDLEIHRRQIRLGAQENRIDKYHDAATFANLAILDFGLDADATTRVLTAGLDLLAGHARYSLRELVGTLLALRHPGLRKRENILAREGAYYCSAMVQHCFTTAGVAFAPGVATKNITPEDIAVSPACAAQWELRRNP